MVLTFTSVVSVISCVPRTKKLREPTASITSGSVLLRKPITMGKSTAKKNFSPEKKRNVICRKIFCQLRFLIVILISKICCVAETNHASNFSEFSIFRYQSCWIFGIIEQSALSKPFSDSRKEKKSTRSSVIVINGFLIKIVSISRRSFLDSSSVQFDLVNWFLVLENSRDDEESRTYAYKAVCDFRCARFHLLELKMHFTSVTV